VNNSVLGIIQPGFKNKIRKEKKERRGEKDG